MSIESEIYPNSPLDEVVFEIRFYGEPAIECQRDKFYAEIRDEYPHVLVPPTVENAYAALQAYRFEKEDKSSGVMLAINRFSYYSKKYAGYVKFREEAMILMRKFEKIFQIGKINRTGWRYINIIPFTRENGVVPLERYLNLGLLIPKSIPSRYENLSIIFMTKTNGGSITVKLESMMAADKSHEALLLDFDYAKTVDLIFDRIGDYMEESHRFTREVFEDLITDTYRKYLRGETV